MRTNILAFLSGALFAVGLGVAGMTRPEKVIGFLDVANWDPALLFVMAGAMMTYMVFFPLVTRRRAPLAAARFEIPRRQDITGRLVIGSALFGIGWGIAGFCPGPAMVSLATGAPTVLAFVAAMGAGMVAYRHVDHWLVARRHVPEIIASAPAPNTVSNTLAQRPS